MARKYGMATQFFAEVHPSEANYVALLGGDNFGIHDDDGYSCKPGKVDPFCAGSAEPGHVDHTIDKPHLGSQLEKMGLSWKGYYESISEPGSGAFTATLPEYDDGSGKTREGCCGVTPDAASNFGGGHIPTVVITNHGPRGVSDPTPYNHYSMLRTFEDLFGIKDHLRHAGDKTDVVPMTPLFAVAAP